MPSADQLLADLTARAERTGFEPTTQRLQKIRYSHDAMIDLLIECPSISQGQLATLFGYTQGWVSIVMSSDAFQARLAERKAELVDPAIRATLEERFKALTNQSLAILAEKLSQPASMVPDNLALRCAELGAKALGLGGNAPAPAPSDGNAHLAELSGRLVDLLRQRKAATYEGEVVDVTPPAPEAA